MNARIATRLPPLPAPPHDPYSLLLAGWIGPTAAVGWRVRRSEQTEIAAATRALVLAPSPDAERRATEPSGSFGGLRLPINVALGPRGEIYSLDPVSGKLAHFDPCACQFIVIPCATATADETPVPCKDLASSRPRRVPLNQLLDPHGIAIGGNELFIADSGHSRILRCALYGFVAREALRPPAAERSGRPYQWQPTSLAFNRRGELFASDPLNQRIDHFDSRGHWRQAFETPRPVWQLAFDTGDRLYAVLTDAEALILSTESGVSRWRWKETPGIPLNAALLRLDGGQWQMFDHRSDRLQSFTPLPLAVDADGILRLPCADGSSLFDARGRILPEQARAVSPLYRRQGVYYSRALDSEIEGCQWHRVQLQGNIPQGCSVAVQTLTAQIELDDEELAALSDSAWSSPATARTMADGRWDCLVMSTPGRFAWLRLELAGDGYDTPRIESILVEYPRISLRRYLPAVFGAEPVSADFTDRFTAIFDTTLRSIEGHLDRSAGLFDPLSAPADKRGGGTDFLSWIASWIGVAVSRDWPETRRRRYIKEAARLYCLRGTPQGLRQQLLLLLGFDLAYNKCPAERPQTRCVPLPENCGPSPSRIPAEPPPLLLEHFKLRRWLWAGRGRLGDDSVLWGNSIVNRSMLSGDEPTPSGNARIGVTQLISTPDPFRDPLLVHANRASVFVPARIRSQPEEQRALQQLLDRETPAHVELTVHYVEPRFRVGVQAMIGLDSVIARTPQGVKLSGSTLGQGTVLTGPPGRPGQPGMEIGDARVGTTSVLR